jgi:hypothetical protein
MGAVPCVCAGSLDWLIVTLNNPVWLPVAEVNAIHRLIA